MKEDGTRIFVSGKALVYLFIISIVFFGILDIFAYVNSVAHKQQPTLICNNKKE